LIEKLEFGSSVGAMMSSKKCSSPKTLAVASEVQLLPKFEILRGSAASEQNTGGWHLCCRYQVSSMALQ
jgi:hypothetical protein